MADNHENKAPSSLLLDYARLFTAGDFKGTVLDLACGGGRNGLFLARQGLSVILMDHSQSALERAKKAAEDMGITVRIQRMDLEVPGVNPLARETFGGIMVFRYLHRPLIPCIRKALNPGGILLYETFTVEQPRFGKPRNPDYLLRPGELREWFSEWELIHYFEGVLHGPDRAVAQLVCRRPEIGP